MAEAGMCNVDSDNSTTYLSVVKGRLICPLLKVFFFHDATTSSGPETSLSLRLHDHTQRRTTFCRTPLGEWSPRRRDLYLTTHDTHNRQISMPPVGFEPTISAGERPQGPQKTGGWLSFLWVWFNFPQREYYVPNKIWRRFKQNLRSLRSYYCSH
jgi:hypothetical protein